MFAYSYLALMEQCLPAYRLNINSDHPSQVELTYQSYSAVSTRSSILELTSSKIRFSAVFLLLRKSSVAANFRGPPADVDDLALMRSCSSSWHAISKCSRLIRICTIWPKYCEPRRSTNDLQTFSVNSSSRDYIESISQWLCDWGWGGIKCLTFRNVSSMRSEC